MQVSRTDTVFELKCRLQKVTGFAPARMALTCNRRRLANTAIAAAVVPPDGVIEIVIEAPPSLTAALPSPNAEPAAARSPTGSPAGSPSTNPPSPRPAPSPLSRAQLVAAAALNTSTRE
jgi:hypothetical protein